MKHCTGEPLNMIGMNIPSIYGGIVGDQYWESQQDNKLFDRKLLKQSSLNITGWSDAYDSSSNDEEEKHL
jgi:hypothetical protein